ncbi:PREDICTED: heat shock protein beta-7-like isoform X2 [Papilio polytes]|uniref:heat shock protein beta-7-like isoform X2 n=1 Tax=Papilio polytes TaxID=76194 RepID=UPI000675DC9F|nr:PREDICTED: heat shock protein beta-7-like isoform X2 [Papilio polytes]
MANFRLGEYVYQKEIPVAKINRPVFDNEFLAMKEHFENEMRRMDQEITRFRSKWARLISERIDKEKNTKKLKKDQSVSPIPGICSKATSYNSQQDLRENSMASSHCSLSSSQSQVPKMQLSNERDVLKNSPLVVGEGEDKKLKLQFDLSQFDPSEVKVTIVDDILMVEATHIEKTPSITIYREYAREVQLPKGLDPDAIYSNLSRDGVLTVQASLSQAQKYPEIEEPRREIKMNKESGVSTRVDVGI